MAQAEAASRTARRTHASAASGRGRGSLVDDAEQALRNWLTPARHRSGDRLPPEHDLAGMLGVSRGTLRAALHRLEENEEIVRRQGSGTFVGRLKMPAVFGERLEHLEPYSSFAARRGMELAAIDVTVERAPVGEEGGAQLGLEPDTPVLTAVRTLVADGTPVAFMRDIVHPDVRLPSEEKFADALREGQMVLDILIKLGVQITYARTRVSPLLLTPTDPVGRTLQVRCAVAGMELEELVFAGADRPVALCRDKFAPGGIEVMVMRSVDTPAPSPIAVR